jgi:hypothetical protein
MHNYVTPFWQYYFGTWLRYVPPIRKTSISCVIYLHRSASEIYTNRSTAGYGNCDSCSTHAWVGQPSVGTPEPIWMCTEYLTHTRLRNTDCTARGESLYRLGYPGRKYHKNLRSFFLTEQIFSETKENISGISLLKNWKAAFAITEKVYVEIRVIWQDEWCRLLHIEDSSLLESCVMSLGKRFSTFRKIVAASSLEWSCMRHSVASQKAWIFNQTVARTSNLA